MSETRTQPTKPDIRLQIFDTLLKALPPGRLLDLATGHGRFAVAAQAAGWTVTGVDVRTERMPEVEGIQWVQHDVRSYEIGEFDCITIFGLLYHLEAADQLSLLRRCSDTLTIVDTHFGLTATSEQEGYRGRLFDEDLSAPTASWINTTSFWPVKTEVERMMYDAGYGLVLKVEPDYRKDRSFWLCVPKGGAMLDSLGALIEPVVADAPAPGGAPPQRREAGRSSGISPQQLQRLRRDARRYRTIKNHPLVRLLEAARRRRGTKG